MTPRIRDIVHKIEFPIPYPLQTVNVFLIDEHSRTLVDAGIKTGLSLRA